MGARHTAHPTTPRVASAANSDASAAGRDDPSRSRPPRRPFAIGPPRRPFAIAPAATTRAGALLGSDHRGGATRAAGPPPRGVAVAIAWGVMAAITPRAIAERRQPTSAHDDLRPELAYLAPRQIASAADHHGTNGVHRETPLESGSASKSSRKRWWPETNRAGGCLPAVLELLVLGATLTLAAWAAGADAHRRSAAARALDRYAASRGLVFAPAPEKPRGASPRVTGAKDGIPYVFDLYRLAGEMRTRISTDTPRGRSAVLSVGQRGAFTWDRAAVLQLGEPQFDEAYVVMTGEGGDADALREAAAQLLVLNGLRAGVWLRSDGHKVTLSWRGVESDPIVLDAARDALVLVAARHSPHAPYR